MNKKTLSKISAILCLTTMLTSGLTQISYASSPDNLHHHYTGKITSMRIKELLTHKNDKGMNILMNILATFQKRQKFTENPFIIESTLKYAKKLNMLSSILTEKDNDGNTALKYALYNQKSFEIILKYAEDAGVLKELLTSTDNEGKTILMHAAGYKDDNQIIDLILSYAEKNDILDKVLNATTTSEFNNCSFEHSALTFAVENNQLNNAKKLIEKGCNGIKCLADSRNDICSTTHKPIIKSLVRYKNFDMVKLLVENNKLEDLKVKTILKMDINELSKLIKENKKTEVFDMLQKWSKDVSIFYGFKFSEETLSNLSTIKS